MSNIAIFASGSGSNAQAIMDFFGSSGGGIKVALVVSNRVDAYVLERAKGAGVPSITIPTKELKTTPKLLLDALKDYEIDFIVLAGFMVLMPSEIVGAYPNRIVNIHPALLPKFGGKGMYGDNVHRAVIEAKEKESGITVHYVNEKYDEGAIIFQASTLVAADDTPESLANKIHTLEHKHYAKIIENIICKK